jgi:hypothetical protein
MVGAKLLRVLRLGGTARDRNGLEAHRPGKLHPEMAEPTDAEDRDPVTWQRLRVAQRVVGRDTRAPHRGRFGIGELGRNPGQGADGHGRRLRISAGVLPTWDFPVLAMNELAFTALIAVVAASAEPADGDTITDRELFDARPEFGNFSGDFMPGSQRPRHAGESARNKVCVSAADPARGDGQPCLITTRGLGFDVDQLQGCACGLYVDGSMCGHRLNIGLNARQGISLPRWCGSRPASA